MSKTKFWDSIASRKRKITLITTTTYRHAEVFSPEKNINYKIPWHL